LHHRSNSLTFQNNKTGQLTLTLPVTDRNTWLTYILAPIPFVRNWGQSAARRRSAISIVQVACHRCVAGTGCSCQPVPNFQKEYRTLRRLFFSAPYRTLLRRSFLRGRFSFENRAGNVGDTTGEIADKYHYPYYHHRQNHIGHSPVSNPLFQYSLTARMKPSPFSKLKYT